MDDISRERFNSLVKEIGVFLLLGVGYYLFISLTGMYIPCVFRTVTGYLCPGCGISHYFVHLFHLEFAEAYQSNQFIFILMPFAVLYGAYKAYRYVKTGRVEYTKAETGVFIILIICAIGFGIYRNL